jgi:acetoin utilization protein AcuB
MLRRAAVKVRERMTTELITVNAGQPLRRVWELVEEKMLRRFPVLKDGRLIGIITDRDLRNATASSAVLTEKKHHDFLLDSIKVESVMTADPQTVSPDDDIKKAAGLVLELKVGGLPVVEEGRLVGIITETDMIKALIELLPD